MATTMKKGSFEYTDYIHALPNEILCKIFDLLPTLDRLRMALVCKRWKNMVEYNLHRYENAIIVDYDQNIRYTECSNNIIFMNTLFKFTRILEDVGWGLNSIDLKSIRSTPSLMQAIASNCSRLHSLIMPSRITPEEIAAIAQGCKKLEKLDIYLTLGECDDELATLFRANPKISDLVIQYSQINGSCLRALAEGKRRFKQIFIKECFYDTMHLEVLRDFEFVRIFFFKPPSNPFHDNNPYSDVLEMVSGLGESLAYLSIKGYPRLSNYNFEKISRLTELIILDLLCSLIGDYHLQVIVANCQKLRVVDLSYCIRVSDAGLCNILRLPELRVFKIVKVPTMQLFTFPDLPKVIPKLMRLIAYDTRVDLDGVVRLIDRTPNLRILDIGKIDQIFIDDLSTAWKCSRLTGTCLRLINECTRFKSFELVHPSDMRIVNMRNPSYRHSDEWKMVEQEIEDDVFSGIPKEERPLYFREPASERYENFYSPMR